jgi:hypothetical protein
MLVEVAVITDGAVGTAFVTASVLAGPFVVHLLATTETVPATFITKTALFVPCPDNTLFPVPVTDQVYVRPGV